MISLITVSDGSFFHWIRFLEFGFHFCFCFWSGFGVDIFRRTVVLLIFFLILLFFLILILLLILLFYLILYVSSLSFKYTLLSSSLLIMHTVSQNKLIDVTIILFSLRYLGLHLERRYGSGPFFFMLPLPFGVAYFWHFCDSRFKKTSMVR